MLLGYPTPWGYAQLVPHRQTKKNGRQRCAYYVPVPGMHVLCVHTRIWMYYACIGMYDYICTIVFIYNYYSYCCYCLQQQAVVVVCSTGILCCSTFSSCLCAAATYRSNCVVARCRPPTVGRPSSRSLPRSSTSYCGSSTTAGAAAVCIKYVMRMHMYWSYVYWCTWSHVYVSDWTSVCSLTCLLACKSSFRVTYRYKCMVSHCCDAC